MEGYCHSWFGISRQGIEELDGTLRHLVGGVQEQMPVETGPTSVLTDAMSGIPEAVDVVFIDGAGVPVQHEYADRMCVAVRAGPRPSGLCTAPRTSGGLSSPGVILAIEAWTELLNERFH
jgi:hypothetical protein